MLNRVVPDDEYYTRPDRSTNVISRELYTLNLFPSFFAQRAQKLSRPVEIVIIESFKKIRIITYFTFNVK